MRHGCVRPGRPLLASVCALGLAGAAACGGSGGSSAEEDSGPVEVDVDEFTKEPIPDSKSRVYRSDIPNDPDGVAPLRERLAFAGIEAASESGGVVDENASAECPPAQREAGETVTCTVTYRGDELTAELEITEVSDVMFKYDLELTPLPVTRDVVEEHYRVETRAPYAACDMDETALLDPDDPEDRVECRAWTPDPGVLHTARLSNDQDLLLHTFEDEEAEYDAVAK
ncbi:hypothetical protein FHX37_0040 [Haloactinospora alba]|uniref:DUF4333 domain-containing protein n=1 Tax=Haloactinospora alba TaxID=405555 RepID=A0A543NEG2_9ACTN|nr:hypothetical protein [Haloactinospora alba]TQN30179.1 hypothetical protein FHX37_0040 [Haloactinospora alba]